MNKWLRRVIVAALVLVLLAAAGIWLGLQKAQSRATRQVSIDVVAVPYRSDDSALQRGGYLYASRGCADCHATNGGGRTLVDDGKGLRIAGPNITSGNPRTAAYREADWVRAIRHGVGPGGHVLRVMPSEDYNRLSDDDLASLVAHVRALPSQRGNEQAVIEFPLVPRVLYGFGAIPEAVEKIDHKLPVNKAMVPDTTPAYGEYVAQMCKGCHGGTFAGGRIPGSPPEWPAAPRLSAGEGSVMPRYVDAASFQAMLKSGKRPDGSAIAVMPFEALRELNHNDVQALFAFLKSAR